MFRRPPARCLPQGSVIAASAEATASQGACLAALAKVGRKNTLRRTGKRCGPMAEGRRDSAVRSSQFEVL